jgi:hypothetical protein
MEATVIHMWVVQITREGTVHGRVRTWTFLFQWAQSRNMITYYFWVGHCRRQSRARALCSIALWRYRFCSHQHECTYTCSILVSTLERLRRQSWYHEVITYGNKFQIIRAPEVPSLDLNPGGQLPPQANLIKWVAILTSSGFLFPNESNCMHESVQLHTKNVFIKCVPDFPILEMAIWITY